MNRISAFATLALGAVIGAGVVVACSDDSPGNADAATCDCPAAEPPLAGRIVRVTATAEIAPNGFGTQGVSCAAGSTLLGGSCRLMDGNGNGNVYLNEAGIINLGGQGYQCEWHSMSLIAATGIATAICLMPAQ